jgi:hypothetical protein
MHCWEKRAMNIRDVTNVELTWDARLARVRRSQLRVDTTGMTRPRRDPDELAFLGASGQLGPFVEGSSPTA